MHACSRRQRPVPRPVRRPGGGRRDRCRRRGGALQPAQARQAPGAVLGVGAARSRRCAGACAQAGLRPQDLDAVAYSFDPALAKPAADMGLSDPWDHLRIMYAEKAPGVPRHRAARARPRAGALRPPPRRACRLGRSGRPGTRDGPPHQRAGARRSRRVHLPSRRSLRATGDWRRSPDRPCRTHSGLLYESLTEHLGFLRSSDEFKVMALASYGTPRHLDAAARDRPRHRRRRVRRARSSTGAQWARPRGAGRDGVGARSTPTSPRRCRRCLEEVLVDARLLAARAHRRPHPDHGRRHGAELRCQQPDLARDAL